MHFATLFFEVLPAETPLRLLFLCVLSGAMLLNLISKKEISEAVFSKLYCT
jgi:hypothetical protein